MGAGAAAVVDGGQRLPLVELDAGGEYLVEAFRPERLADLVNQLIALASQRWPHLLAGPLAQAFRRPSRPATSSMACSRPTSEVVATGSRRGPRDLVTAAGARATGPLPAANRSLNSAARSSRTSRPSSAAVVNRRYEASSRTLVNSSASRASRSGAGVLTYSSRGIPADRSNSSSNPDTVMPGLTWP